MSKVLPSASDFHRIESLNNSMVFHSNMHIAHHHRVPADYGSGLQGGESEEYARNKQRK